ncbi:alpha/beta fold hydrolase [Pseudonocardia xinjiangensis]|uniref:alpha/beta fold hydrolase n=1 Tax=Pseudonocardia xinjiangensis TaxID=75289 RepID=UPI003D8EB450
MPLITVNDVELDVQISGAGPTVLLVHGWPDTHACWRHQVAALNAAGYRTVAPDLRGFGASGKPEDLARLTVGDHVGDLIGLLRHLDVEKAHLVGHDWGSALVQQVAMAAPALTSSLTCMSVGHAAAFYGSGLEQREKSWYMLLFQFRGVAEQWLSQDEFRNLREFIATHPDLDEVVERMRDPKALSASLAIYRTGVPPEVLLARMDDSPPLPPVPTMGLWSTGDRYLVEAGMVGTENYASGPWRYERIDGAGHWMQLDAPERVNELLLDFLPGRGEHR